MQLCLIVYRLMLYERRKILIPPCVSETLFSSVVDKSREVRANSDRESAAEHCLPSSVSLPARPISILPASRMIDARLREHVAAWLRHEHGKRHHAVIIIITLGIIKLS